jgi:hypothetical protein
MEPNVLHNVDTGLRISIVASGKLHRATSGGWWLVTNHHDSGFHRHPTIARGFTETVNWDLRDPQYFIPFFAVGDNRLTSRNLRKRRHRRQVKMAETPGPKWESGGQAGSLLPPGLSLIRSA